MREYRNPTISDFKNMEEDSELESSANGKSVKPFKQMENIPLESRAHLAAVVLNDTTLQ